MRLLPLLITLFAALGGLAGCDSDSDSDGDRSMRQDSSVTPSLGLVMNAPVQAFDTDGNALSEGTDRTGEDGLANLSFPADHAGPVIVVVSGDEDATYFDEALGETVPFPPGRRIRALLPAPRAQVGVSPLTELAAALADASGEALDAGTIERFNERVRVALAADVDDLLTPPTLVGPDTGAGTLGDDASGRMAARLGALARLGAGDQAPALKVLEQLSADLADGVIDGIDADGPIDGLVYSGQTFADDFSRNLELFARQFGDPSLRDRVAGSRPETDVSTDSPSGGDDAGDDESGDDASGDSGDGSGDAGDDDPGDSSGGNAGNQGDDADGNEPDSGDTGSSDSDGFVTEPASVDDGLVGTYALVYFDSGNELTNDPFEDEQELEVVVGDDDTLTVGAIGPLTDPFLSSGPSGGAVNTLEIIWEDPATGLFYALTDNENGTFNEINVGDPANPQASGFPGFLGQIREAEENLDVAAILDEFGTNANFRVTESCTGNDVCPDETPAGEMVRVVVSGRRVAIGSIELDPGSSDLGFVDQREGTIEPRLDLTFPGPDTNQFHAVSIYPAQFKSPPVAGVRFRFTDTEGPDAELTLEYPLELRAGPHLDYVQDFETATQPPVELVYIADDEEYFGKSNSITSAPRGTSTLCRSFEVQGEIGRAVSGTLEPQFGWFSGEGPIALYEAAFANLTNIADGKAMTFLGGQFVLSDTAIRLDEGFVDNSSFVVETPRDVATSDAGAIAGACTDFRVLGGDISVDAGGSVTVEITDTESDSVIFRRGFVFEGEDATSFDERLPNDLAYEVSASGSGTGGAYQCALSDATGTLTADDATAFTIECITP